MLITLTVPHFSLNHQIDKDLINDRNIFYLYCEHQTLTIEVKRCNYICRIIFLTVITRVIDVTYWFRSGARCTGVYKCGFSGSHCGLTFMR